MSDLESQEERDAEQEAFSEFVEPHIHTNDHIERSAFLAGFLAGRDWQHEQLQAVVASAEATIAGLRAFITTARDDLECRDDMGAMDMLTAALASSEPAGDEAGVSGTSGERLR